MHDKCALLFCSFEFSSILSASYTYMHQRAFSWLALLCCWAQRDRAALRHFGHIHESFNSFAACSIRTKNGISGINKNPAIISQEGNESHGYTCITSHCSCAGLQVSIGGVGSKPKVKLENALKQHLCDDAFIVILTACSGKLLLLGVL